MSSSSASMRRGRSDNSDNPSSNPSTPGASRQQGQAPQAPQQSRNARRRADRRANRRDDNQGRNSIGSTPTGRGAGSTNTANTTGANIADANTTSAAFDITTPVGLARFLRHQIVSYNHMRIIVARAKDHCRPAVTLWWLVRDHCLLAHQHIRYMGNLYTCRYFCGCLGDSPDWRSRDFPHPWFCLRFHHTTSTLS